MSFYPPKPIQEPRIWQGKSSHSFYTLDSAYSRNWIAGYCISTPLSLPPALSSKPKTRKRLWFQHLVAGMFRGGGRGYKSINLSLGGEGGEVTCPVWFGWWCSGGENHRKVKILRSLFAKLFLLKRFLSMDSAVCVPSLPLSVLTFRPVLATSSALCKRKKSAACLYCDQYGRFTLPGVNNYGKGH